MDDAGQLDHAYSVNVLPVMPGPAGNGNTYANVASRNSKPPSAEQNTNTQEVILPHVHLQPKLGELLEVRPHDVLTFLARQNFDLDLCVKAVYVYNYDKNCIRITFKSPDAKMQFIELCNKLNSGGELSSYFSEFTCGLLIPFQDGKSVTFLLTKS